MKKKDYVNLAHARQGKYEKLLKQIGRDGVCPFCESCLKKYHHQPIIKDGKYWRVTPNQNPYRGLKIHLLFICRRHIISLTQLKPKEWADLVKMIHWSIKRYQIPGGAFFVRFGNTDYTGASVSHLHAHLVVGGKRDKNKLEIKTKIGYHK